MLVKRSKKGNEMTALKLSHVNKAFGAVQAVKD